MIVGIISYLKNASAKSHAFKKLMKQRATMIDHIVNLLSEAPIARPITTECTTIPSSKT